MIAHEMTVSKGHSDIFPDESHAYVRFEKHRCNFSFSHVLFLASFEIARFTPVLDSIANLHAIVYIKVMAGSSLTNILFV